MNIYESVACLAGAEEGIAYYAVEPQPVTVINVIKIMQDKRLTVNEGRVIGYFIDAFTGGKTKQYVIRVVGGYFITNHGGAYITDDNVTLSKDGVMYATEYVNAFDSGRVYHILKHFNFSPEELNGFGEGLKCKLTRSATNDEIEAYFK